MIRGISLCYHRAATRAEGTQTKVPSNERGARQQGRPRNPARRAARSASTAARFNRRLRRPPAACPAAARTSHLLLRRSKSMKIAGPLKRPMEQQRSRPNLRPVVGLVVGLALYAGVLQFTSSSAGDELLLMSGGRCESLAGLKLGRRHAVGCRKEYARRWECQAVTAAHRAAPHPTTAQ